MCSKNILFLLFLSFYFSGYAQEKKPTKKLVINRNTSKTVINEPHKTEPKTTNTTNKPSKPTASKPVVNAIDKTPKSTTPTPKTSFESQKGKLPWPVQGKVILHFGKQSYPGITSVYINNAGIDIAASQNSIAKTVYSGKVSAILTIPGNGIAVIVQHGNYYSVYNNLTSISVSKGETVVSQQKIGIIAFDKKLQKAVLNFQIWNNTTKLNPANWLK